MCYQNEKFNIILWQTTDVYREHGCISSKTFWRCMATYAWLFLALFNVAIKRSFIDCHVCIVLVIDFPKMDHFGSTALILLRNENQSCETSGDNRESPRLSKKSFPNPLYDASSSAVERTFVACNAPNLSVDVWTWGEL